VDERAIRRAMRMLFLEHGVMAEGSAATVAAALLDGVVTTSGPLVAVVSGGNVDAALLASVLQEDGQPAFGRAVALPDA
jgi:threonine dehydratase